MKVAALFVATGGPYFGIEDVEPYDIERNAFGYDGPFPVVAHPPCERWGRYWGGGPSAKVKRKLGDDGGAFEWALRCVRLYGGVLEHPEATHAWARFGLSRPARGSWQPSGGGWVTEVDQGVYGHPARKRTWLFACSKREPPCLDWAIATGRQRADEGFHSKEERLAARLSGASPRKRLSKRELVWTPDAFRDVLLNIAKQSARANWEKNEEFWANIRKSADMVKDQPAWTSAGLKVSKNFNGGE